MSLQLQYSGADPELKSGPLGGDPERAEHGEGGTGSADGFCTVTYRFFSAARNFAAGQVLATSLFSSQPRRAWSTP